MKRQGGACDELDEPVLRRVRSDFVTIGAQDTVRKALDDIRATTARGPFVYFYVVDADRRLVGVLQTRKLITSPLDARVSEIMAADVAAMPDTCTLLDACEFFARHRFLALPVVDAERRIVGVLDVGELTGDMMDMRERAQVHSAFDTLGVRASELRGGSLWNSFRSRFPWLLGTIASGTACAAVAGLYEATLAHSLVLAFFLTLVLGLGESVSMQTMGVAVHALHHHPPRWRWYLNALRREILRTLALGAACACVVGAIAWLWKGHLAAGAVIAGGIFASLMAASFLGLSIPTLLHRLRLDLRVASGPLTLAVTDVFTIAAYLTLASRVLGR